MYRGFIPTWRKSLESRVFKDPFLWHLWSYILLKARSEAGWVNVETGKGETEVWLEPGQMIFGRNRVARKLKQKPTSTYKRLLKLEKMQNVVIQSNTHYSIVTVLNWPLYAEYDKQKEQPKEQAGDNQGTGKEQAGDTKNNDEPCMNNDEPCISLARSRKNGNGSKPPENHLFTIPLVSINKDTGDPEQHPIYQSDLDSWQDTFPAVDVKPCVKYIRQWNIDNPKKRKTKAGIMRHITTWLAREQNKGGGTFKRDIATSSGTLSWAEKRKLQEQEKADDGSTVRAVH